MLDRRQALSGQPRSYMSLHIQISGRSVISASYPGGPSKGIPHLHFLFHLYYCNFSHRVFWTSRCLEAYLWTSSCLQMYKCILFTHSATRRDTEWPSILIRVWRFRCQTWCRKTIASALADLFVHLDKRKHCEQTRSKPGREKWHPICCFFISYLSIRAVALKCDRASSRQFKLAFCQCSIVCA